MGMDVQETNVCKLVNNANGNAVPNKSEEECNTIFEKVSNNDLSLLSFILGGTALGLGTMRFVDQNVGRSVLKELGTQKDVLSNIKRKSAIHSLKGTKWQIPLYLGISTVSWFVSKYFREA